MITISFIISNTPEEKAKRLLQQLGDQIIDQVNRIIPNGIIAGTPWVYRRESDEPGEPPVSLITDTLEHYLWAIAKAIDRPTHKIWSFDIQCPNHAIAIPDRTSPKFHILKPDQVSTLFFNLAQQISQLVDVEVSCNDDHTRHGVNFHHGTPTKDEHW